MSDEIQEPLVVIRQWEDEPESGRDPDEWPYPTKHVLSLAQGELAERIRRALKVTTGAPVYVEEEVISGGYSEFTQEEDHYLTVRVDGESTSFPTWNGPFTDLLRWLDTKAPVEGK